MQNKEKLNRLEVKKTLIHLKNQTWNSKQDMSKLGGQGQWYGLVQQVHAASLAATEMTSPEIFTSVQVKAWSSSLNYWVNRNQRTIPLFV